MSGNTRGITKHRAPCPDCGRDVPVGWNKQTGDPWTGRHRCNGVMRSGTHVHRDLTYMPDEGQHTPAEPLPEDGA